MAISLALIIVFGLGADYLFSRIKLPGLIGMLMVGVFAGPYMLNLMSPEMMKVSGDFRRIALIVILLRAGFELRREALRRVGRAAVIMSAVPAIFEIFGIMLVAPKLLHMTYLEAAILGSILAAVSPAVVVPLMIDFMDRGRGSQKGIPTMILGASSLDDVFVIVLFTVFLGMYGGEQANILIKLGEIPVSIVLGIIVGLIPGYFLYKLFTKYDWRPPKRTMLVMGIAIVLTWLETVCENHVPVASLLGVMAIGAVPLAAGVVSGEVILAVAVLSILLTAPIGAIGIMIFGEKILDHGELSIYKFKELREKLALPHVGERVRSRHSSRTWKVIEEREVWLEEPSTAGSPEDAPRLIPAIYLRYWGEETSKEDGKGKTLSFHYTQKDPSFHEHWEILYDW